METLRRRWDPWLAQDRLPGREDGTALLHVAVRCWSPCQGEAEGSLLTPRGQGARKSQSHEAESLMLGAELNGSAWPVPGEEGYRKSLLFLFPQ